MAKVALCVIATQKYIDFVGPLLESADEYFLQGHEVDYHIFTDHCTASAISGSERKLYDANARLWHYHPIKHEPWPAMTLKRFHFISSVDLSRYDYVYYIDADMRFVAPVGDEIFGELVAVAHPGYAVKGGGSWETRKESMAYVPPAKRGIYVAGGFQGGSRYWAMCDALAGLVDVDKSNGITPKWHDESVWNALFSRYPELFTVLPPSYCMTESIDKRKAWGIENYLPKILALEKDHKQYQK